MEVTTPNLGRGECGEEERSARNWAWWRRRGWRSACTGGCWRRRLEELTRLTASHASGGGLVSDMRVAGSGWSVLESIGAGTAGASDTLRRHCDRLSYTALLVALAVAVLDAEESEGGGEGSERRWR